MTAVITASDLRPMAIGDERRVNYPTLDSRLSTLDLPRAGEAMHPSQHAVPGVSR
jgi:hypothetical protein